MGAGVETRCERESTRVSKREGMWSCVRGCLLVGEPHKWKLEGGRLQGERKGSILFCLVSATVSSKGGMSERWNGVERKGWVPRL